MQIRARVDAWITGRGSCGKAGPCAGASRQIWHARISPSSASSGVAAAVTARHRAIAGA
jgi:hypothetical protein